MKKTVGDKMSIVFAAAFYEALSFDRTVTDSFKLAKLASNLVGLAESDTPELFVRAGAEIHDPLTSQSPKGSAAFLKLRSKRGGSVSIKLNVESIRAGGDVIITGISIGADMPSEPVSKVLYINLWIEDQGRETLSTPAVLMTGLVYTFMFAVEGWSREEGGVSESFVEPPELRETPVTTVVIELLCSFLEGVGGTGYLRQEVSYHAGVGFSPQAFQLKPDSVGRFFLTARLLIKGETIYREVLLLEVVGKTVELSSREARSVATDAQ
jgi:hypothetical protein